MTKCGEQDKREKGVRGKEVERERDGIVGKKRRMRDWKGGKWGKGKRRMEERV